MNNCSSIRRKSLLYKTGVEYGDYTINIAQGCSHGCKYPYYAMMLAKRFGTVKTYDEWVKPLVVSNTIELLNKELLKLKDKIKSVHLCFTTDPFMYGYDNICNTSLKAIKLINSYNIPCTVLTKGILPVGLASLSRDNSYGITLVSLNEDFRKQMEPNTSPYKDRIESLKRLHDLGCKTWVSIEPYPTPNIIEQNIDDILNEVKFVDKIIFGRLHYNKKVSEYKNYKQYYNELAKKVLNFCKENNIECHIKNKTITNGDDKE